MSAPGQCRTYRRPGGNPFPDSRRLSDFTGHVIIAIRGPCRREDMGTLLLSRSIDTHDQMYSSAIAPFSHLATVTMRSPLPNSPTTHVHSPEPNLIGCDMI
jgi:hypothetical protein